MEVTLNRISSCEELSPKDVNINIRHVNLPNSPVTVVENLSEEEAYGCLRVMQNCVSDSEKPYVVLGPQRTTLPRHILLQSVWWTESEADRQREIQKMKQQAQQSRFTTTAKRRPSRGITV